MKLGTSLVPLKAQPSECALELADLPFHSMVVPSLRSRQAREPTAARGRKLVAFNNGILSSSFKNCLNAMYVAFVTARVFSCKKTTKWR